jgi:hypothetical protein
MSHELEGLCPLFGQLTITCHVCRLAARSKRVFPASLRFLRFLGKMARHCADVQGTSTWLTDLAWLVAWLFCLACRKWYSGIITIVSTELKCIACKHSERTPSAHKYIQFVRTSRPGMACNDDNDDAETHCKHIFPRHLLHF